MRFFNEKKTKELSCNDIDLNKGYLKDDLLHHAEQQEVLEVKETKVVKEYANGGKEIEEVVTVPYQPHIDAYDEEIKVYVFYTAEELLQQAKEKKLAELKALRDSTEIAPITTDKGTFEYDSKSKERIKDTIEDLDNYTEKEWTLADNSTVTVRKCDLSKVVSYVTARTSKLHNIYQSYKELVNNATTIEEVESISANYPTELTDAEKTALAEKHRLSLKCSKRKFIIMLNDLGVKYSNIQAFIAQAGEQAQMEWELCTELWRDNALLDPMSKLMGVSSDVIDLLFEYENGEVTDAEYQLFVAKATDYENTK